MANWGFTRDEVILALDVLYYSGAKTLDADAPAIQDLSALLNRLPIHPLEERASNFRSAKGVSGQILTLRRTAKNGKRNPNVGALFYEINTEYEDNLDELHRIAEAIRRNEPFYERFRFGSAYEAQGFPEGALLGHLHMLTEARDGPKAEGTRCEVCMLDMAEIYTHCPPIIAPHLTVPPTEMQGNKKYGAANFIQVCPNCHAALHRRRPWLTREHGREMLR